MKQIPKFLTIVVLLIACLHAVAQVQDSTHLNDSLLHRTPKTNIFNYALKFIKRKHADTSINQQKLLNTKSEDAFLPYEGKIIRHVLINEYGFEKSFTDTSKRINYFGTRILSKLHKSTRQWVLREALFIKENAPVVAYRLADNERYLRSLDYIQDARIVIDTIKGETDSVDVSVITKDLFSLTGELNNLDPGKFKAKIGDVNLLGGGQNLQTSILLQKNRNPTFGAGVMYTKYNIAHTYIDATGGYTNINPDLRDGTNDEHAVYFSLQRNLISQYSHFAGGITAGIYQSFNHFSKPEIYYFDYKYGVFDAWTGYNLGVKKFIKNNKRRNKQFISLRYFNQTFYNTPNQVKGQLNFRYNDKEAVLSQFTFFKQEYYKTNYIYGFGTTEDIPYGYNIALTGGYYKQAFLSRFYAGIDANRYLVYNKGDIVQYFLRTGTFWDGSKLQDGGVLIGGSLFSRLFLLNNFKLRQYVQLSYAKLYNRTGLDPLSINNPFGIRYFSSDSVRGNQRLSLHSETLSFINYKLFGFKFSPFQLTDITSITPENNFQKSEWFYGVGGGLRMRNENLVFKTAELRFIYFPRKATQHNSFVASLRINLNFKYNSNYVREPDIIQLNSDVQNNIF